MIDHGRFYERQNDDPAWVNPRYQCKMCCGVFVTPGDVMLHMFWHDDLLKTLHAQDRELR